MKKRKYLLESFGMYKDIYKDPFKGDDVDVDGDSDEVADEVEARLQGALDDEMEDMDDTEDMEDEMEDEQSQGFAASRKPVSQEESEPVARFAFTISSSTNNDTPSQPAMTFKSDAADIASTTSFKRPEWAVTRVMTNNGERIAMEYQNATDCEVLAANLSYEEAEKQSTDLANKLNVPEYNNELDQYIGKVSNKVVRKPQAGPTSYRP